MAIIEVKDNNPVAAIQELLRSMLEEGLVSAVLVPQEIPSKKTVVQTLLRDPAKLDAVNPLAPVFGVNSARIVAKMCIAQMADLSGASAVAEQPEQEQDKQPEPAATENQASEQKEEQTVGAEENNPEEQTPAEAQSANEQQPAVTRGQSNPAPIALVLRPCEIRALVELVKLQQAIIDPFLVIGVDCWGTYSVEEYAAKVNQDSQASSVTADFLKQVTAGNLPEEVRGACRVCQYPAPTYADVAIQLIGDDINQRIHVQAQSEKGKELFAALGLEDTPESGEREKTIAKLKDDKKQLAEQDRVDFLETISSLCINCHNCRAVCPICYCKQCVFDGQVFEYPLEKYLNWSGKKGVLPMPPDKLLFHLTRMSHVATSCVACGQCEAACPNGIPLGRIYQKISAAAQEALGYEAGRSLDEELPLTTFREDELSVVEN
ncbi:MAG: 4Fe-4S dicluster domain-containing protein [Planctomycetota bacterium]